MELITYFIGIGVGIIIGVIIFYIIVDIYYFTISQETADDICEQLTGNKTAIAKEGIGKRIICELPSFDETQNIIVRTNSEE